MYQKITQMRMSTGYKNLTRSTECTEKALNCTGKGAKIAQFSHKTQRTGEKNDESKTQTKNGRSKFEVRKATNALLFLKGHKLLHKIPSK